jgi:hypothetical protein
MKTPENRIFYGMMKCLLPLWPTYIGEKGRTLGLKRGAIGNTLWEHIGNLGNILKTHWEQRKKKKFFMDPGFRVST